MDIVHDLRYAARSLSKAPGFTALAVLTLAVAIAGNATIFGAIKDFLFEMPPVEKPRQMARVWSSNAGGAEDPRPAAARGRRECLSLPRLW